MTEKKKQVAKKEKKKNNAAMCIWYCVVGLEKIATMTFDYMCCTNTCHHIMTVFLYFVTAIIIISYMALLRHPISLFISWPFFALPISLR